MTINLEQDKIMTFQKFIRSDLYQKTRARRMSSRVDEQLNSKATHSVKDTSE